MPYFAPPGGSFTSRTARALQDASMTGLGSILPSVNVRMPRGVSAAIGAARRLRFDRFAPPQTDSGNVMTGMGIVSPRVHYVRTIPASVTFAAARALQAARAPVMVSRNLSGLGKVHAQNVVVVGGAGLPSTAGVRRQAAMFMQPGGGYSQIPGFLPGIGPPMRRLSGLGDDPTIYDPGGDLTPPPPPPFIFPPQTVVPFIPAPITPVDTTMIPAPTKLIPPGGPAAVQNKPILLQPGSPGVRVTYVPSNFMDQAPLGVPNKFLAAGAAAILLVVALSGGRRRRNPGRRRRARQ